MTAKTNIRPLRSEADYRAALAAYESFFDREPAPGTVQADAFELLGMVIAHYEAEHYPMEAADPVEVLKLVMEGRGLTRKDLGEVLGSAPRATEVLNRRRSLTLDQIRRLHRQWGIPAEALLGQMAAA